MMISKDIRLAGVLLNSTTYPVINIKYEKKFIEFRLNEFLNAKMLELSSGHPHDWLFKIKLPPYSTEYMFFTAQSHLMLLYLLNDD